jgi:hypothetical protein
VNKRRRRERITEKQAMATRPVKLFVSFEERELFAVVDQNTHHKRLVSVCRSTMKGEMKWEGRSA